MEKNILDTDEKILGRKFETVEYIERTAIYGIAVSHDKKVGVIKTSTGYFLPGGGIEKEESHKQCLKREFLEETGYEIDIKAYVGRASLYHISKTNNYIYGIGYFYQVNLKDKRSYKFEQNSELLWVEPDECVKLLFLEHQAWAVWKALANI